MSKKAKTNNNRSIKQFLEKPPQPPCPATTATEGQTAPMGEKRKLQGNLNSFIIKKNNIKAVTTGSTLHFACDLLQKQDQAEILKEVPAIDRFAQQFQSLIERKKCVRAFIWRFLTSHSHRLWYDKYSPKGLQGYFNQKTVNAVRSWLKLFNGKSQDNQDDSYDAKSQCKRSDCTQKAMILYGREGVGKMTLLENIASSMGIETHICSNEQDRLKYLKDKDQNTKSECVKVRKSTPTPSVLLTNFFPVKNTSDDDRSTCSQPKKVQIIHEINLIYPPDKVSKFHQDLLKLMRQSMIPFIFTSSQQAVPTEYREFQKIEYKELTNKQLTELFWLIYHIQCLMGPLMTKEGIQKDSLIQSLRRDYSSLEFKEMISISDISFIVQLHDYRLCKIFNTLQFQVLPHKQEPILNIKKELMVETLRSIETRNMSKLGSNLPCQHFHNNLTDCYSLEQPAQTTLQGQLARLTDKIDQDLVDNCRRYDIVSQFHRDGWHQPQSYDLSNISIKEHYEISGHRQFKSKLSRQLNSHMVNTCNMYSSMQARQFCLLVPEKARHPRTIRQLLEDAIGIDNTKYLMQFSELG